MVTGRPPIFEISETSVTVKKAVIETKWSEEWLAWAAEPLTPYLVKTIEKMIDEGKIKQ